MNRDKDPADDYYSGRDTSSRRGPGEARDPGKGGSGSGWFDDGGESRSSDSGDSTRGADERQRRREDPNWETFKVSGDRLVETVKRIVREGNARRIVIRNDEDRVLLEFPLTAGVVGAALLPMWAAIGAVAALVGNCSIEVERRSE